MSTVTEAYTVGNVRTYHQSVQHTIIPESAETYNSLVRGIIAAVHAELKVATSEQMAQVTGETILPEMAIALFSELKTWVATHCR